MGGRRRLFKGREKGYLFCLSGKGKKVKMVVPLLEEDEDDGLSNLAALCFLKEEKSTFNYHVNSHLMKDDASCDRADKNNEF